MNADLSPIAAAIKHAQCPGREGPYGLYNYGQAWHVRDFRSPGSKGDTVFKTPCPREANEKFRELTDEHIAASAISADPVRKDVVALLEAIKELEPVNQRDKAVIIMVEQILSRLEAQVNCLGND